MNNFIILVLALMAGLVLGTVFFGGLWWTVRKGALSKHPALWFLGSMVARMSLILLGFYFVGGGDWQRLVAGLVGFIIARYIVLRLTRTPIEHATVTTKEANHAP